MKNENLNKVMRIATIAGAATLIVNSGMGLMKVKSIKEGIMPAVAILVGVAAFKYAMEKPVVVVSKA